MNISTELSEFLYSLNDKVNLAYLGLTTKVENPFRDMFAYYLHKKYTPGNLISREYSNGKNQRVDLAIIDGDKKTFIEFKACYSFDLQKNSFTLYKDLIFKDSEKYKNCEDEVTYVLLSIRTSHKPDLKYRGVIKYIDSFSDKTTSDNQLQNAKENVASWFDGINGLRLIETQTVCLGNIYDLVIHLDYFIIQ